MKKAAMIVVLALSFAVMGGLVSDQASAQFFGRGAAVAVVPWGWGCAPAWGYWGCWPGYYCAPACPAPAPKAAKAKAKDKK
jgi:hypothetical protein